MRRMVLALVTLSILCAAPAVAQLRSGSANGLFEFRVGGFFSTNNFPKKNYSYASLGVKVAGYLNRESVLRPNLQLAFDYLPVSRQDYYNFELKSPARIREHLFIANPGIGLDVQGSGFVLAFHYGLAAVGKWTSLALLDRYDRYENVCSLQAFSTSCPLAWNFLGNGGGGVRAFPLRNNPFYLGIDYTRYAGRKNQLVGTIGAIF